MSARRRSWAVSVNQAAGRPEGAPARDSGPRREGAEQEQRPTVSDAPAQVEEGGGSEPPAADRAAP
ncbi:hypothetical protein ABT093_19045 [Kitasatospora sp. NPDC002551]|uniref:hypothetical protein n=1 Tax=Kitasatospora sp. NPDC002551 TaxID=3154539 RepID=UPI0033198BE3